MGTFNCIYVMVIYVLLFGNYIDGPFNTSILDI